MTKPHAPINEVILQRKDLSRFTITRITEGGKCWQVADLATGAVRQYKTKRAAQVAICSVVKQAMQ